MAQERMCVKNKQEKKTKQKKKKQMITLHERSFQDMCYLQCAAESETQVWLKKVNSLSVPAIDGLLTHLSAHLIWKASTNSRVFAIKQKCWCHTKQDNISSCCNARLGESDSIYFVCSLRRVLKSDLYTIHDRKLRAINKLPLSCASRTFHFLLQGKHNFSS